MNRKGVKAQREEQGGKSKATKLLRASVPLWLIVGGFGALMVWLDSYGQRDQVRPAQVIVLLGSRVNEAGTPGQSLRRRTQHAVELWRRGVAPFIICTGGVGDHPPSEAQAAATLAQKMGVPARALLLEDKSTSTWENIGNATRICRPRGWTRVVVVSEPFHLWRAQRNFQSFGIEAHPSPAENPPPRVRWWMAARECFSVMRDVIAGR